ncbi:hypothetical protein BDBG_06412 [Blastomyces gilchristii SLH14081]|uniref:Uncharacterized protein n=1 Tax=Blastomyces gilchristii (strain SLH14081) TaxID=559298 RepID=A0A179UW12_BLAGS|nr:uncharacterized protein BDBG_06412 [Blastomyces gilchristii SLH14081]OAT10592.1 hypothetical protein BDBG_06412 [Blastomyces gilchristii SLH14081]
MSTFNDLQLQFLDWELLRLSFAREEAAQHSIQRLQHHSVHAVTSRSYSFQPAAPIVDRSSADRTQPMEGIQQGSVTKEESFAAQHNEDSRIWQTELHRIRRSSFVGGRISTGEL